MKKIKKILIANRGEIAVRIHRSAKEMGIQTVAIYSDPDRTAPHVLLCDEAYPLHGITSAETYLQIDKILTIAKSAQIDAIHPGYGFLSEKENFAKAVSNAGFIFIGPRSETIELLGSKTSARDLLSKKNIPIVPGTTKPIKDLEEAIKVATSIGFPVLIKASGGGGGKGMRRVDTVDELANAIDRAKNEASKAFSDDRVYIEKYIVNPSNPHKVQPKQRAARGSRKRRDHFFFSKNDLERLLHMARISGDKDMVRKLTPRTDPRTIKRELLASIRQGRAEQDLWNSWLEAVNNLQPVEA